MWRAVNRDGCQHGTGLVVQKPPTSCLQTLDVHESHCAGGSQTLRYGKFFGDPSILGQVNQSPVVEIHADFTQMCLERDG